MSQICFKMVGSDFTGGETEGAKVRSFNQLPYLVAILKYSAISSLPVGES